MENISTIKFEIRRIYSFDSKTPRWIENDVRLMISISKSKILLCNINLGGQ